MGMIGTSSTRATWEKVGAQTLSVAAASISFTSVPAASQFRLSLFGKMTTGGAEIGVRLNADAGNNYDIQDMYSVGAVLTGEQLTRSYLNASYWNQLVWAAGECRIICPAPAERKYSFSAYASALGSFFTNRGYWTGNAAISRIDIVSSAADTFVAGTYAELERLI